MELGFVLKKFISAFLMPLSLSIIIGIVGLYFLYKSNYKISKIFLSICLILILFFSNNFIANTIIQPLESQYKPINQIDKDIKYIVLLGGDINNRGWEVLRLYYKLNGRCKIITSGYKGVEKIAEAIRNANILIDSGIPKNKIIISDKPKDTKEEAVAIKNILDNKRFYLVTSSYHMPRSIEIFKANGLYPIPAPTDYKIKNYNKTILIPLAEELDKSQRAIHEYIGILWLKILDVIKNIL